MPSSALLLRATPSRRSKSRTIPPTLLLASDDQSLIELIRRVVRAPWVVAHVSARCKSKETLAQRNVRLIVLDDDGMDESDCGWLLHQAARQMPRAAVLYIAGSHTDYVEKRARASGAHFYISKPLPSGRFEYVLGSFLKVSH